MADSAVVADPATPAVEPKPVETAAPTDAERIEKLERRVEALITELQRHVSLILSE